MSEHVWYFQNPKSVGDPETVGPLTAANLAKIAKSGKLSRNGLLMSPTRSGGNWVTLKQVAPVEKLVNDFHRQQKEFKVAEKQKIKAEKQKIKKAKTLETQQSREASALRARQSDFQSGTFAEVNFETGGAICSFCRCDVKPEAMKCQHCGEFLNVAAREAHLYAIAPNKWNPGVAAVLSLIIPGVGQIYKGQIFNGLCWLIFTPILYGVCLPTIFLIPVALLVHVCCIVGATMGDPKT